MKIELKKDRKRYVARTPASEEWLNLLEKIKAKKMKELKKENYVPDCIDFCFKVYYSSKKGEMQELTVVFVREGKSPSKSTLIEGKNYKFNPQDSSLEIFI